MAPLEQTATPVMPTCSAIAATSRGGRAVTKTTVRPAAWAPAIAARVRDEMPPSPRSRVPSRSVAISRIRVIGPLALERNLVVQVGAEAFLGAARLGAVAAGIAAEVAALVTHGAAAVALAAEHGRLAAELLQHHLGGVFLDALLVGPFAGLQGAFDVNRRALLQILLGHLDQVVVENHHPVPLGALIALARGAVAPGFRGRQAEVGHPVARVEGADLRILAQIADQNDLVDAARHGNAPSPRPAIAPLEDEVRPSNFGGRRNLPRRLAGVNHPLNP